MTSDGAFEFVANFAQIPDGGLVGVETRSGERVCLIRRGDAVTAVSDVCTHQDFAISSGDLLPDGTIQCAWHGARFDCETGAVQQIPATRPLPVYEVRIEQDRILVGGLSEREGAGYRACVAGAEIV